MAKATEEDFHLCMKMHAYQFIEENQQINIARHLLKDNYCPHPGGGVFHKYYQWQGYHLTLRDLPSPDISSIAFQPLTENRGIFIHLPGLALLGMIPSEFRNND